MVEKQKEMGLSAEEFALVLGISDDEYQKIANGTKKPDEKVQWILSVM